MMPKGPSSLTRTTLSKGRSISRSTTFPIKCWTRASFCRIIGIIVRMLVEGLDRIVSTWRRVSARSTRFAPNLMASIATPGHRRIFRRCRWCTRADRLTISWGRRRRTCSSLLGAGRRLRRKLCKTLAIWTASKSPGTRAATPVRRSTRSIRPMIWTRPRNNSKRWG